jgi:hypothetical protein
VSETTSAGAGGLGCERVWVGRAGRSKFIWDMKLFSKRGSCYVAQAGLEFSILLPLSHECWDYRLPLPCLACGIAWYSDCGGCTNSHMY